MKVGPITSKRMMELLEEIRQDIKELKDPKGTAAKKAAKEKRLKEQADKDFKE